MSLSQVVLIAYLMISRTIVDTYTNCLCKISTDFMIMSVSVLFVFSYLICCISSKLALELSISMIWTFAS